MSLTRVKAFVTVVAATASFLAVGTPITGHADTTTTECQAVPGTYPGANIQVGPVQESVPSISQLNICVSVDNTTAGLPLPQFPTGCGSPCFIMATDGVTAGAITTVQATWMDNGTTPDGRTEQIPESQGVGPFPVCVAVGEPAPACPTPASGTYTIAFNLGPGTLPVTGPYTVSIGA